MTKEFLERHPNASIFITGHSYGAALASICALDLIEKGIIIQEILTFYTYGLPRLGNHIFAQYF
jgi:predicted lipase